MKSIYAALLAVAVAAGVTGCAAPGVGGGDYNRSQVRGEQSVRLANVVSVRTVRIEGTHSGIGGLTGAVAGGIAGNSVGRGNGSALGTVAGAVAGGLLGSAIEQSGSRQEGVEVTVQYDDGRLSAITQGADEAFKVGDRVTVTSGGGVTRVTRVAAGSVLNTLPPPPGSAPAPGPSSMVPPPGSAPVAASGTVDHRWYCPDKGYYPEVATCTSKWLKVAQ